MKKTIYLFLLIFITKIHSQWLNGALYPDLRVNNDSTTALQYASNIGVDGQGNFVIVWDDNRYYPPHYYIYCQLFNNQTQRIGYNFRIGQDTAGGPVITVLRNGEFIVSWQTSKNIGGNVLGAYIWAQKYDFNRNPITGLIRVNDTTYYSLGRESISSDSHGNFVIVWESYLTSLSIDIYGQRFDSSGNKLGQNFKINTENHLTGSPEVTMSYEGSFSVVWEVDSVNSIKIRGYNNNGIPLGLEQKVDDDITNALKIEPAISSDKKGNILIAWKDYRNINPEGQIYYQLIDSIGNKIGINRNADDWTVEVKNYTRCAMREEGSSIIIWNDYRLGKFIPFAQRLDRAGNKIGSNFIIPVYTNFTNSGIESCYLQGDRIYSTWSDNRNGGQNYDVFCNIRSFLNPDSILAINENRKPTVGNYKLFEPYPNPFNQETVINYALPIDANVKIEVYDMLGKKVLTLINEFKQAGYYSVKFDGSNFASGMYFYRIQASNFVDVKKMVLIK